MSESFFWQIRIRIYKTRGKDLNLNPNNSLISDFFQQRSSLIYLVKFLVSLPWVLDNLCKNLVKHWQKSLVACLVCNSHSGYNSWECELELLSVSVWRMRFYLYSGWACCVRDCCSNCILHLGTNCERSAPHCTRGPPCVLHQNPKYSGDNIAWFTLNSSLQTTIQAMMMLKLQAAVLR